MNKTTRLYWQAFGFALLAAVTAFLAFSDSLSGLARGVAVTVFCICAGAAIVLRFKAVSKL